MQDAIAVEKPYVWGVGMHSREKPYARQQCMNTFYGSGDLKKHKDTHWAEALCLLAM